MILPALLLTLDKYSSWRVGRVVPMIRSAVRTTLRSLLWSDLVAELNQTVIEVQRTDSMMAEYNCFSSSCGRLNFLSWRRKYNFCWAFFYNGVYVIVPLQVLGDGDAQEVKSSQVTFIYIVLLTIQIVSKQLHNIKIGK